MGARARRGDRGREAGRSVGVALPSFRARSREHRRGWRRLVRDLNSEDPRRGAATPYAGGRNGRRAFANGRRPRPERTFDPMKRETTTHYQTDEAKILALFEDLLADWGRGDGEAYGSRFTEDADYVAFDGTRTRGKDEISASHQELFDRWLEGTQLTGRVLSVKFLSSDVALVHATGGTVMRGKTKPSPE